MRTVAKLLILSVIISATTFGSSSATEKSPKSVHKENDPERISKVLTELLDLPDIQFVEYGPEGEDGYKYHLSADSDKQYVIHTSGPVFIPINDSFGATREEKDRKLLELLLESPKLKSMELIKAPAPGDK